jgi:hypothetical protein
MNKLITALLKVARTRGAGVCVAGSLLTSCVGTTGGELLEISAYAAGPEDAEGSLSFENSLGYRVELREARLFVGGVYLNRSRPSSVASDTSCSLPGIYVAEVLSGRELDLLSPVPQAFPARGFATTERALTGEVWLHQGDVNQEASGGVVLRVTGSAERDGSSRAFSGKLTIGKNRVVAPTDAALPGQQPICKQRVVSPIPLDLRPAAGGALLLRVDARAMFGNVDFDTLEEQQGELSFADASGVNQASDNLYAGLRRSSGVYEFSWMKEP